MKEILHPLKQTIKGVTTVSILGIGLSSYTYAADFRIIENLDKAGSGPLNYTVFDGYGQPIRTVSIIPTSRAAAQYISELDSDKTYACRVDFPTVDSEQIFTSAVRCVPQSDSFRLETSQTSSRSLDDVYEEIQGEEVVVDEDIYSVTTVKEDATTSCRRYYSKPPNPFVLTTSCVFNRQDPLTDRIYSCFNEQDCI